MTRYPYETALESSPPVGLVVLQTDETIESDMRRMLPVHCPLMISRVPSAPQVTPQSLRAMSDHITRAASLLPQAAPFAAIGYGCTSASAHIGPSEVAKHVNAGVRTARVTDPLSALVAACTALEVRRIAFLSPYTPDVSSKLRDALTSAGVASPVFGSFEEADEARVVRISGPSIVQAACDLARQGDVDAVFLSCTNLRTLDVIAQIEAETGLVCLSSNQVLAWHLKAEAQVPGRLNAVQGVV